MIFQVGTVDRRAIVRVCGLTRLWAGPANHRAFGQEPQSRHLGKAYATAAPRKGNSAEMVNPNAPFTVANDLNQVNQECTAGWCPSGLCVQSLALLAVHPWLCGQVQCQIDL